MENSGCKTCLVSAAFSLTYRGMEVFRIEVRPRELLRAGEIDLEVGDLGDLQLSAGQAIVRDMATPVAVLGQKMHVVAGDIQSLGKWRRTEAEHDAPVRPEMLGRLVAHHFEHGRVRAAL